MVTLIFQTPQTPQICNNSVRIFVHALVWMLKHKRCQNATPEQCEKYLKVSKL